MQLGEVDALAVEAEAPAESRHHKADRDDPPALVTGGRLDDRDVTGRVQRCLSHFKTVMARQKREAPLRARCPAIHVFAIRRQVKTRMPGTRPGMTITITRSASTMLRPRPKCGSGVSISLSAWTDHRRSAREKSCRRAIAASSPRRSRALCR